MTDCVYKEICSLAKEGCPQRDYWDNCYVYRTLDGLLKTEVYRSRKRKKVMRGEDVQHHNDSQI